MNDHPIGVFDSGLGGLTVLQAMADLSPDEHLIYFGDTARYPYGPRSADELTRFSFQIADVLLEHGIKMLVVACNSATAAALDELRDKLDIPVIGVVAPGVRAAMKATTSGRVGVIGTQMTVESRIYETVADDLRSGLDLHLLACPGFVELVETGEVRSARARAIVREQLAPMRDADIDALVLGCTHYPLLARTIGEELGREVTLVSSADETAFEVRAILERTGWSRASEGRGDRLFLTSGDAGTFRRLGKRFLGFALDDVRTHTWEED